jgi:hypothetical protein
MGFAVGFAVGSYTLPAAATCGEGRRPHPSPKSILEKRKGGAEKTSKQSKKHGSSMAQSRANATLKQSKEGRDKPGGTVLMRREDANRQGAGAYETSPDKPHMLQIGTNWAE